MSPCLHGCLKGKVSLSSLLTPCRRVGSALQALAGTRVDRPALRDGVLSDLRGLDPEAELIVRDVLARAATADAAGKAGLVAELSSVLPDAAGVMDALGKHGLAFPLPAKADAPLGVGAR